MRFFTIRQFLYWLSFLSSIIPIVQLLLIIASIMTNTMTCAIKREAWTWYLPSHLVPAKILCSRCEPCTKAYLIVVLGNQRFISSQSREVIKSSCVNMPQSLNFFQICFFLFSKRVPFCISTIFTSAVKDISLMLNRICVS